MHRLTARLLLLFAITGTFVPIALAYSAPVHACCVRKTTHHCHEAASNEDNQLHLHAGAGCNHDCCRGAATSQSARPQSPLTAASLAATYARALNAQPASPSAALVQFQSTRAPPAVLS